MRRIILILLFLFTIALCHAQQQATPRPKAKYITGFSFQQFTGGVILIRAMLNNIPDSLNFILDTGSGGVSLDSATCVEFGIQTVPSDTVILGMGGTHKVSFAFNQSLGLPGLNIKGLNFHVNNYDLLSCVYGEKIDGVIGYGFFSKYIVKIDFDRLWIDVYSPGKFDYPKGGSMLHPIFTSIPIQSAQVKDSRKVDFNFYFDTGAGLCFLMSQSFAKDSTILLPRRHPVYTSAEGMGGTLEMKLTVVKSLQVGSYKFKTVPAYIYDDHYNVTSYPYVGGLIGNDLWRRFNLVINYPDREIHLSPNTHFGEPFDYSYTGLTLYYVNDKIIVDDIADNSPASRAGFKKDDIIIGVENNFSNNLQQYKNLLQSSGDKVRVTLSRDGQVMIVAIKPIDIL